MYFQTILEGGFPRIVDRAMAAIILRQHTEAMAEDAIP
jgi:hypothetical protein